MSCIRISMIEKCRVYKRLFFLYLLASLSMSDVPALYFSQHGDVTFKVIPQKLWLSCNKTAFPFCGLFAAVISIVITKKQQINLFSGIQNMDHQVHVAKSPCSFFFFFFFFFFFVFVFVFVSFFVFVFLSVRLNGVIATPLYFLNF